MSYKIIVDDTDKKESLYVDDSDNYIPLISDVSSESESINQLIKLQTTNFQITDLSNLIISPQKKREKETKKPRAMEKKLNLNY